MPSPAAAGGVGLDAARLGGKNIDHLVNIYWSGLNAAVWPGSRQVVPREVSMLAGIALGLAYSNVGEWLIHKYVLHGLGKKKGSFFSFHWHDHHKNARRGGMRDHDYDGVAQATTGQWKEVAGLAGLALAHLPLAKKAPWFVATVVACQARYYYVHRRSHLEPEWARRNVPWHVDHHLGPNQHANWCVTAPWFDHLVGTREPYVGTPSERPPRAERQAEAPSAPPWVHVP